MKAKKSTPIDNVSIEDINMNQKMYETYSKSYPVPNVNLSQLEISTADDNKNSYDTAIAIPLTKLNNIPGPPISP